MPAASALAADGHGVTLIVPASDAHAAGLLVETIRVAEYPPVMAGVDETGRHLTMNIAMFERAAATAADDPPDVIHAFGDSIAHAAVSLRRALSIPLVVTPGPSSDPLALQTGPWVAAEAGRVVVASPQAARRAALSGADEARIRIVRGGPGHAARLARVYGEAVRDAEPLHAVRSGPTR